MTYENLTLDEERALYGISDSTVKNCRFDGKADGESALKEANRIKVENCFMNLRYPFWHLSDSKINGCELTENCRAALWYDKNLQIENCKMNGIKALRECENIVLKDSVVSSPEFIWKCKNLTLENVEIKESEYPFFEVKDAKIKNLKIHALNRQNKIQQTAIQPLNIFVVAAVNVKLNIRIFLAKIFHRLRDEFKSMRLRAADINVARKFPVEIGKFIFSFIFQFKQIFSALQKTNARRRQLNAAIDFAE